MPLLKSITIKSCANIERCVFNYLPSLKILQILKKDTVIDTLTTKYLHNLEYLHICSNKITENNLKNLVKLKVLVLEKTKVTPEIINHLPKLEVLIINQCLYKYCHTLRNISIIQKIGHLKKIHICNIK
jgi:hypothetical protein